MTPLEERFVAEYRVSRNATQSALRAGYSGLHASRYGSRLLRNPAVIEALRAEGVEIAHGVHPPSQVRAPRASAPMTPRQLAFVAQYRLSRNAAQAAREAGYTGRDAGLVVLRKPAVLAALAQAGVVPARGVHPRDQKRKARPPYEKRGLTVLEERFAMEYLIDGNATQAAIRSGLPSRKPLSAGTKMLHRPAVAAAIAAERQRRAERVRVSADRVLGEMARIAFSDIGAIAEWDEDGVTLKPKAEIGPHDRAAIVEYPVAPRRARRRHPDPPPLQALCARGPRPPSRALRAGRQNHRRGRAQRRQGRARGIARAPDAPFPRGRFAARASRARDGMSGERAAGGMTPPPLRV